MDTETLKQKIEQLDPAVHKALRGALIKEYNRISFQPSTEFQEASRNSGHSLPTPCFQPFTQKFDWKREWEEEGKFIWREKGELTIESSRLGGQTIKLLAKKERYNPECSYPQFVLPDDFELIEALGKALKVFAESKLVRVRDWRSEEIKKQSRTSGHNINKEGESEQ